jgi:hypothetical protein
VTPLRARVATIAASALLTRRPRRRAPPDDRPRLRRRGAAGARDAAAGADRLDVLRAGFAPLAGKRVGLVTNHTGRARDGATTIDLLFAAKDVKLVTLFSPEHGIRGVLDANVPSDVDEKTKLPILSLYGDTRGRPTRCSRASTRSSSISGNRGRASIPT